MAQRYIYLTEELNQKLKQEDNASALISKLLLDYYQYNIEDPKEALKLIEEKKTKMIEEIEKEKERYLEVAEQQEAIQVSETELEELRLKKRNMMIANCITNTKKVFDIDLTIAQAEEYLNGSYDSVHQYLKLPTIEDEE